MFLLEMRESSEPKTSHPDPLNIIYYQKSAKVILEIQIIKSQLSLSLEIILLKIFINKRFRVKRINILFSCSDIWVNEVNVISGAH